MSRTRLPVKWARQEWDAVFVLNVIDGCIPSDMAVGSREQIEEERRARQHLHLVQPMRLFRGHQHRHGDGHTLTMRSRFIPDGILDVFERRMHGRAVEAAASAAGSPVRVDVAARMQQMWD
jgi:DNA helicase II / ATP-dependent DNA helicase PcrA